MKRILITGALCAASMIMASLVDTCGRCGDMFVGALLTQIAIVAAGVMAEAIIPGSSTIVMKALEAWLSAS